MTIGVTGANGFVGTAVLAALGARGLPFRGLTRSPKNTAHSFDIGDLTSPDLRLTEALAGCDAVIHLAARAHIMDETAGDPLSAFRAVNVGGTMALARAARAAGVRRLIYVSSIKVLGEATRAGQAFTETDTLAPQDAYAISKSEAEAALRAVASHMEIVIVRPPLVYGPGVKANLAALTALVRRGVPLPFAAVRNQRSLIGADNLADILMRCAIMPEAANKIFLVADGPPVSTPYLVNVIAKAMGHRAYQFAVPVPVLRLAGRLTHTSAMIDRLCNDLVIDDSQTRHVLRWTPPLSFESGIISMLGSGQ